MYMYITIPLFFEITIPLFWNSGIFWMYNLVDGDFSDSHRLGMQKPVIYLGLWLFRLWFSCQGFWHLMSTSHLSHQIGLGFVMSYQKNLRLISLAFITSFGLVYLWVLPKHCVDHEVEKRTLIETCDDSGQIIIFHQPRCPWNKGISSY